MVKSSWAASMIAVTMCALSLTSATAGTAEPYRTATDASAFKGVLPTADAGGTGWVTANVHSRGTVTRNGLAEVQVTYRCQLPGDSTGSTEVYRVLQQHPGSSREVWDDGYDVDEFWCDGSRITVPHAFSSETGRFHPGWVRLTLDIRVCTGDVTDDPGTCFSKVVTARLWLRPVRAEGSMAKLHETSGHGHHAAVDSGA
jgi:hypothetical protein